MANGGELNGIELQAIPVIVLTIVMAVIVVVDCYSVCWFYLQSVEIMHD